MIKNHNPALFEISVKLILTNDDGKCLVLKTAPEEGFGGKDDLPGGRINKDEVGLTFHHLVEREVKEEIGETLNYSLRPDPVAVSTYLFTDREEPNNRIWILFEAKYLSGEIKTSDEHIGFEWVGLDQSKLIDLLHPSLEKLIKNYFEWNKK